MRYEKARHSGGLCLWKGNKKYEVIRVACQLWGYIIGIISRHFPCNAAVCEVTLLKKILLF